MPHQTGKDITLKRAYEPAEPADGVRILVDRLWPRGVRKDEAAIDHHLKGIAPSTALRRWFRHDPKKWAPFRRRYLKELEGKREEVAFLEDKREQGTLTLVYAAKDSRHNNAVVLRDYLLRLQTRSDVDTTESHSRHQRAVRRWTRHRNIVLWGRGTNRACATRKNGDAEGRSKCMRM